jgi:hypothetical protein
MVESLGSYEGAFRVTLVVQLIMFITNRVTHVNFRVPYGEFGVIRYVGIHVHYIVILYRLSVTYRVMKTHSNSSTPVQNITCMNRSVLNDRMLFQFGMARLHFFFKVTFKHYLYGVP